MFKKKGIRIICCLLILTFVLAGCGNNSNSTPGSDKGGSAPSNGGVKREDLIFALAAEPTSLDPKGSNDTVSFRVMNQVFDTLVKTDSDGTIVPGLAEEWKVSEDNTEITFKIREGVKFHNGDVMTVDDVVYSVNEAIKSNFTKRTTNTMKEAVKIDDSTVKLILNQPYGPALKCMATISMGIVNKRAMEENPDGFARNPIGTGPYKFVEWKTGEKLVFERFDDYYRGAASIKDLTFKILTDQNTGVIALENGEVDVLETFPKSARKSLIENENISFYETESGLYYHISFNNEKGIFSNKKLRQAVSYAVDRESLIIGAFEGAAVPVECPIPPSCFGYVEDFKGNEFNPDKARELLAEAGYPDGLTVTMKTLESASYTIPTEIIQAQLREVGINAEIEIMERGAFLSEVYDENDYEISLVNIVVPVTDADFAVFGRLHSSMKGSGNNIQRCDIPELDELIMKGRSTQDEAERKEYYEQITEIVKEEAILIPLLTDMSAIAANKDLKGVEPSAVSYYFVYNYSW